MSYSVSIITLAWKRSCQNKTCLVFFSGGSILFTSRRGSQNLNQTMVQLVCRRGAIYILHRWI